MSGEPGACCRKLLSDGLDLCVRARKLDGIDRRQSALDWSADPEAWQREGRFDEHVRRHNEFFTHAPMETRSLTPTLWANDQYEKDLADWEARARKHLMQGCGYDRT